MAAPHSPAWDDLLADAEALRPLQQYLNDMPSATERKVAVMQAHCMGLLSEADTQLLFDVYDLATA